MNSLLEPILHSPLLPDYVEELTSYLRIENEKRAAFYYWLDEDKRAEFIDGEVVVHSPARSIHITSLSNVTEQIKCFVVKHDLGLVLKEQALVKMKRSDFMPDLVYYSKVKAETLSVDTKIFPVPDFIIEFLSPSTEHIDRKRKYEEYALNGVKEYWIADADKKIVEQYMLLGQEYLLKRAHDIDDQIECMVLSGLYIDVLSIFDEKESQKAMIRILNA